MGGVAERGGNVVGFVGIGDSRDPVQEGLGELDTIAVAPASWRTGIGHALIDSAVAALRDRHHEAILWTVAGYERGHRFYEAMGWRLDGAVRADGAEVRFRRTPHSGVTASLGSDGVTRA